MSWAHPGKKQISSVIVLAAGAGGKSHLWEQTLRRSHRRAERGTLDTEVLKIKKVFDLFSFCS